MLQISILCEIFGSKRVLPLARKRNGPNRCNCSSLEWWNITMGAAGRDRRVRDFPKAKSASRLLKRRQPGARAEDEGDAASSTPAPVPVKKHVLKPGQSTPETEVQTKYGSNGNPFQVFFVYTVFFGWSSNFVSLRAHGQCNRPWDPQNSVWNKVSMWQRSLEA